MYRQWRVSELTTTDVTKDELGHTPLLQILSISVPWNITGAWIFIKVLKVGPISAFHRNLFIQPGVSDRARWWLLCASTSSFMHSDTIRSKTSLTVAARYQVSLRCLPLCFLHLLSIESAQIPHCSYITQSHNLNCYTADINLVWINTHQAPAINWFLWLLQNVYHFGTCVP